MRWVLPDRSSNIPLTCSSRTKGITTIEAIPSDRQLSRFTRGSVPASSQRRIFRVRTASAESPDSTCRRAPRSGADSPGTGATNHFVALPQRDGCAGGSSDVLSALCQQLQRSIEVALSHVIERFAAVIAGKTQALWRDFARRRKSLGFALRQDGFPWCLGRTMVQDGVMVHANLQVL